VMTDIEIISEQFRSKQNLDFNRENDMATTASVTFIKGNKFYGIHTGDSDWQVIRGDRVITQSRHHDAIFQLLYYARSMVTDEWKRAGRNTEKLVAGEEQEFEGTVAHRFAELKRSAGALMSGVSVLGDTTHIQINNMDNDPVPLILEPGDLVVNASDGLRKRVCHHEINSIFQGAGKDVALASGHLLALAEGRMLRLCKCDVSGEKDDTTFVLRKAEGP